MTRYLVIVQPSDGSPDHWLDVGRAADADRFAKWVHKATGAAVQAYDDKQHRARLTLGAFDASRT